MRDNRSCTCHPDEAPKPCQKRYAFSECQAARIEQLEGQHKGLVLQNALLRQRPDLPVDRIPAAAEVRALIARIEQLEAALREILEYNGGAKCGCDDPYVMERARAALEGK